MASAVVLGAARWRVVSFTLSGFAQSKSFRAGLHVSYFEADAYARWAVRACPLKRNGRRRRPIFRSPAISSRKKCFHPRPLIQARPGELAQMFGDVWNGREARMRPILVTSPPKARLASTTASSCAINMCCVAARAPLHKLISGGRIEISRRTSDGSSWNPPGKDTI